MDRPCARCSKLERCHAFVLNDGLVSLNPTQFERAFSCRRRQLDPRVQRPLRDGTRPDQTRLVSKLELAKLLKYWGYRVEQRFQLMLVIDALLTLPEPLENAFHDAAQHIEDEHTMERLNSFQRVRLRRERQAAEEIGMQKGLQAGLAKGIQQGIEQGIEQGAHTGIAYMLQAQLQQKFGDLPEWINQRLRQADTAVLQHWGVRFVHAQSLHDVFES